MAALFNLKSQGSGTKLHAAGQNDEVLLSPLLCAAVSSSKGVFGPAQPAHPARPSLMPPSFQSRSRHLSHLDPNRSRQPTAGDVPLTTFPVHPHRLARLNQPPEMARQRQKQHSPEVRSLLIYVTDRCRPF